MRPIHYLCNSTGFSGDERIKAIQLLIDKKVNLRAKDSHYKTPLNLICEHETSDYIQVSRFLLDELSKLESKLESNKVEIIFVYQYIIIIQINKTNK